MFWIRRLALSLLLVLLAAAAYLTLRGLDFFNETDTETAQHLGENEEEIAYLLPATSSEEWGRLLAVLDAFNNNLPAVLQPRDKGGSGAAKADRSVVVNLSGAFPARSADVPEVSVTFSDGAKKLWFRWYKLGGQATVSRWIDKLVARGRAPLAVVGGDTSNRALETAQALQATNDQWKTAAPLFLMTTATADRYLPAGQAPEAVPRVMLPRLIDVYPNRTFRFSFTNAHMVRGVLDFVRQNPQVWSRAQDDPIVLASYASVVCVGQPLSALGLLRASGQLAAPALLSIAWLDDRYSIDMAEEFLSEFLEDFPHADDAPAPAIGQEIRYSTGDFFQPNPREQAIIDSLLNSEKFFRQPRPLLALPTGVQRVRRFVRGICRQAPTETRNVVVLSGDSISFNHVYRDRDIGWNVQDLPVTLIMFAHRNPIDRRAGFRENDPGESSSSTSEVLLQKDLVEAILASAFDNDGGLTTDAEVMRKRLEALEWSNGRIVKAGASVGENRFFAAGNRRQGTGEHIVWLQPTFIEGHVQPLSTISVWGQQADRATGAWRRVGVLRNVAYNRFGSQ